MPSAVAENKLKRIDNQRNRCQSERKKWVWFNHGAEREARPLRMDFHYASIRPARSHQLFDSSPVDDSLCSVILHSEEINPKPLAASNPKRSNESLSVIWYFQSLHRHLSASIGFSIAKGLKNRNLQVHGFWVSFRSNKVSSNTMFNVQVGFERKSILEMKTFRFDWWQLTQDVGVCIWVVARLDDVTNYNDVIRAHIWILFFYKKAAKSRQDLNVCNKLLVIYLKYRNFLGNFKFHPLSKNILFIYKILLATPQYDK